MTLRDFRIGWRLLLKEPGYSLAVVLGLAVGFAVCFLLLGFVRYSFSYNEAIPGSDVKAGAGVNAAGLATLLQETVSRERDAPMKARMAGGAPAGHLTDIAITRLSDIYFDPDMLEGRNGAQYGNKAGVAGLAALAVLILLLAGANYVNLATVRTLGRQREIGIRKVMGVSGMRLAGQFVAESLVVSMLATLCGLFAAWLALPLFAVLVNRPLAGFFSVASCAAMLALGALVGLASALYPAWLALGQPASVAIQGRGNSETRHGLMLRRVLSVFQFAAAIALIATTFAVSWQTRYASHVDPGFDAAQMLTVALPGKPDSAAAHAFGAALARVPGVTGVTATSEAVGRNGNKITYMVNRPGIETVPVEARLVSPEFFHVYRLGALAGRVLDPEHDGPDSKSVVINAIAAAALGFSSPEAAVGQMFNDTLRIVGIVPDLRYQNLRQAPGPMMYRIVPAQGVLTARVEGSVAAMRPLVEALWTRHFPDEVPDIEPAAAVFAQNYSEDARLAKILGAASVVATALASFGIYVLAAYSVKRRSREIVLRKLHGAGGVDVGRLVAREFAWLTGIGALIGLPVAWLAIERYLAGFVERAPIGGWPLLYALACVALVALAATARHTVAAARMSPALALRDY